VAAAVIVVVALAITAVVLVISRDESAARRPEGLLAGTYPQQPTAAWTVRAADLLPGSTVWTPNTEIDMGSWSLRGLIDAGDRIVVRVVDASTHRTARLVALDAATGRTAWAIPFGPLGGCAAHLVSGLLACISDDDVVFIKMSDGGIASKYTPDFMPGDVASDGNAVVVAGGVAHDSQSVNYEKVISSGTVNDPAKFWTTKVDATLCHNGNSDELDVRVDDGFVGTNLGMPDAALKLGDGSTLVDDAAWLVAVFPGTGAVVARCIDGYPPKGDQATFFGPDAQRYRTGPAPVEPMMWVTALANPPVLLPNGTAVDFVTGDQKWSAPSLAGLYEKYSLVGDVAVHATGTTVTAYDMHTGKSRWSTSRPDQNWLPTITDGARVIGTGAGRVIALSLTDGSTAWTFKEHVVGDDYLAAEVAQAGLVTMTADAISLYRPTGGPSHVPGEIGTRR
jgi:outer membrane protein assembly factor BamB